MKYGDPPADAGRARPESLPLADGLPGSRRRPADSALPDRRPERHERRDPRCSPTIILATLVVVLLGRRAPTCCCRTGTARPSRGRVHAVGRGPGGPGPAAASPRSGRRPGPFLSRLFFYAFSLAAVAGARADDHQPQPGLQRPLVRRRSCSRPSGLFLLAGAQFLAAGTVIVYAGAIIVTFLFVIMLAQMEGQAVYDRAARVAGRGHVHLLPALLVPALRRLLDASGRRSDPRRRRSRRPAAVRRRTCVRTAQPRSRTTGSTSDPAACGPRPRPSGRPRGSDDAGRRPQAARRRAGRDALHRPPGHRRAGRRPAVRRPDRRPSRSPTPAADPPGRPAATVARPSRDRTPDSPIVEPTETEPSEIPTP